METNWGHITSRHSHSCTESCLQCVTNGFQVSPSSISIQSSCLHISADLRRVLRWTTCAVTVRKFSMCIQHAACALQHNPALQSTAVALYSLKQEHSQPMDLHALQSCTATCASKFNPWLVASGRAVIVGSTHLKESVRWGLAPLLVPWLRVDLGEPRGSVFTGYQS